MKAMERDNWNRRSGGYESFRDRNNDRNFDRDRGHNRRFQDRSQYRGAYRLDNDSNERNETTYNGFDRRDDSRRHTDRNDMRQGGDYIYRRSRNLEDNDHYSRTQHRESRGNWNQDRDYDQNWDRRHGSYSSNFNNNYGPDNYSSNRDENYGNMAGSLSFGYDGDNNSDPDHNRMYDPMSGRRHSYHGSYRTRRPENQRRPYGPPDNTGMNPDYDRY